jgi:NAD(P)-dependent dehydrogenase (short-subunit alcohol dehydrogenase family)
MPSSPAPRTAVLHAAFAATLPGMAGKSVAITGCTSGTGLVLARTCGELGARVVMVKPSVTASRLGAEGAGRAGHRRGACAVRLAEFESVRAAAVQLKDACAGVVDVLCNNAGVMGLPDRATGDGYDEQMQSNHLSHFLLTSQILQFGSTITPALANGATMQNGGSSRWWSGA